MEGGKWKAKRLRVEDSRPLVPSKAIGSPKSVKGVLTGDKERQTLKRAKKKGQPQAASKSKVTEQAGGNEVAESSGAKELKGHKAEKVGIDMERGVREPDGSAAELVVESGKRKAGDEIDSIFGNAKKKGRAAGAETGAHEAGSKPNKVVERLKESSGGGKDKKRKAKSIPKAVTAPGVRKKTTDGLTVYSEAELGFGKKDAGGTPLCPFDCQCCF